MFGDVTFAQAPFASLGGNAFSVSASESATAVALLNTPSVTRGGLLSETATGSDSSNRGLLISVALAESATGTATQVTQVSANASISEVVSALSTLGIIKTTNVRPTGVQLYINIGGALVWAVIDDSQNPNWQNIVNAQGSGWTVINDVQSPGWTQLPS